MPLTLDDLRKMDRDTITPSIAGQVLGCDPYNINVAIRDAPESIGFPWFKSGSHVKIPREGFIRWMEGRETA